MGMWVLGLAALIILIILVGIIGLVIFLVRNRHKKSILNIILIVAFSLILLQGLGLLFGQRIEALLIYANISNVDTKVVVVDDEAIKVLLHPPKSVWYYERTHGEGHGSTKELDIYIERTLDASEKMDYEFEVSIGEYNRVYLSDYWGHRKLIWTR
jgi:hypothetical protein